MPEIHASASAVIPGSPPIVYGLIADYRHGHPSILPPRYFQNLEVVEGGVGAGTRIRFEMRSFGSLRRFHGEVSEPEPGRQLRETYPAEGMATTFTVDPADAGKSRVTIETRYAKPGLAGWIERWLAPGFLRAVYRAELRQLEEQVKARMAFSS